MSEKRIRIPHGKTFLEALIPEENIEGVLVSKEYKSGVSQEEAVEEALRNPVHSPRLRELSKNARKLLIITNDMTRPMPSTITLPALIREAEAGNDAIEITILVASGLHREMTPVELEAKMGKEILDKYRVVVHNAYDQQQLVYIGQLSTGNPLWLNKEVIENDLIISEGFIEAHWLAGFSGGRKSIVPGIAGCETVMNNHSPANVDHHCARLGILEGNPAHDEFREATKMAGLTFIFNVVLDKEKRIIKAFAGDTFDAHIEGCKFVRELMGCTCKPADIVITSNNGYPLDINLYQSVKGLDTAAAAARDGAVLIISTECAEGVGQEGFIKVYDMAETLEDVMHGMRTGKIRVFDQWSTQVWIRLALNYKVIVVTNNVEKVIFDKMGVMHAPNLQEAFDIAMGIRGKDARVNIIPEGPVIIPLRCE